VGELVVSGVEAEVVIFHAIPPVGTALLLSAQAGEMDFALPAPLDYQETVRIFEERARTEGQVIVDQAREALMESGVSEERIRVKVIEGEPDVAQVIVREAEGGGYDLVAIGRKGRSSLREFLIGGVTDRVVRHCAECAVLVVE
jgi:nucleotide-binding universal stress UspA family protein